MLAAAEGTAASVTTPAAPAGPSPQGSSPEPHEAAGLPAEGETATAPALEGDSEHADEGEQGGLASSSPPPPQTIIVLVDKVRFSLTWEACNVQGR